jgi:hypothetical protein
MHSPNASTGQNKSPSARTVTMPKWGLTFTAISTSPALKIILTYLQKMSESFNDININVLKESICHYF